MYRNLAVRTSRFGFNFCKHGSIYNLKHHKFVPTFSKTSLIRNVSNQPNDSSNGNTPPLKPVQDNNKTNSDSSNTAKEIPASTVASEETENNRQATEESHSQPSENSPTENVGELLLRSPRRKRSTTRLRSRASKPINQYKPVIPQLFLKENYLCYKDNTHSFDKMSYPLEDGIRDEIIYSARANLLPLPRSDTVPARRGHLLLNCPIEGASFYLDAVVKSVAASLQADLLTFDRQDLMELTASMFSRKGNVTPWPLFPELKGFNPYIAASPYSTTSSFSSEDEMDDDVFIEEEEGFESSPTVSRNSNFENKTLVENFQYNSTQSNGSLRTELKVIIEKVDKFFEALVSSSPTCAESTSTSSNLPSPPKIIYFRDVGDLVPTTFGSAIINSLVDAVQNQRHAGDQIMIVAGYSPSLFAMDKKSSTNSSVPSHEIQWVGVDIFPNPAMLAAFTHIAIPPPSSSNTAQKLQSLIAKDKNVAIIHINVRTLKAVCASKGAFFKINSVKELGKLMSKLEGIDSEVWGFERIHRLVMNSIGICISSQDVSSIKGPIFLEVEHFIKAANILKANHKLRKDFVECASTNNEMLNKSPEKLVSIVGIGDGKLNLPNRKNMRKEDLDKYEKKLLGCVVDPENILVGFSDIHIAESTVQTLQTLITLPLMRPQSFSYGVLSKHFISGVLLFGPPGTGKTMLAKAVAKESGSTVIDIKSSDVYDMYVGEGEKNVRAIFSLARKLSPCVIFLDELDAIFGSRRSDIHNGAHREIINQFMAEWDGLTSRNEGVLVMGATNRPFDLDDAILRRMPRRILVDLPTEKDREQILQLHLRDEKLDSLISLADLAKIARLYSGSDLKNLCISAALAAVREDAEKEQNKSNSDKEELNVSGDSKEMSKPLQPPPIRVLKNHHFQQALKQITPSCSEDMTSLAELRKWDGLYGDGAWNRQKRVKGIGFDGDSGLSDDQAIGNAMQA
ncbi:23358_t:CDS:2 [Entrophospora sp. SA101]|nr:11774_t:CDS:2 [Entrophospora sp. SA101]CAJ0651082.1 15074_t:CDS:2 [Entrophospora sp. SA101]CAJ0745039.1 21480_t:CDS:2 [Entrophospora sp. SA101]CAJ0758070.1 23358_t:CDS:2 [Entrophospora sp. SA101]CAJ0846122.1 7824_t:CDS:2 [Entrophospora sp. SA101]